MRENEFAEYMHSRQRRGIGNDKGTFIGLIAGGCFVLVFVTFGSYKLLKEYGCIRGNSETDNGRRIGVPVQST